MNIVQIAIVGVIGVLLAVSFKSGKSEYGLYIMMGVSLLIFLSIVGKMEQMLLLLKEISEKAGIESEYFGLLIKMLGIVYVSEVSSGICKDAGYQAVASQIEILSKITILVMGMPIVTALFQVMGEYLL